MLLTSRLDTQATPIRGRSFADLMELYEANYMRLRLLVPDIRGIVTAVSRVPDCMDLHLQVYERCRYTSMLRLTYAFGLNGGRRLEPDLRVRIYHDARVAEACSRSLHHGRGRLDQSLDSTIDTKWALNRFLYKWLGYCLHRGHVFTPASGGVDATLAFPQCEQGSTGPRQVSGEF